MCVCILASVIGHANWVFPVPHRVVVCGLSGVPIFSMPHKLHDFQKKLLNIKYVFRFSLQLLSEIFLILRRI